MPTRTRRSSNARAAHFRRLCGSLQAQGRVSGGARAMPSWRPASRSPTSPPAHSECKLRAYAELGCHGKHRGGGVRVKYAGGIMPHLRKSSTLCSVRCLVATLRPPSSGRMRPGPHGVRPWTRQLRAVERRPKQGTPECRPRGQAAAGRRLTTTGSIT